MRSPFDLDDVPRQVVRGDLEVVFGEASFALGGRYPAADLDVRFELTGRLHGALDARLRIKASGSTKQDRARIGAFTPAGTFTGKLLLDRRELRGGFGCALRGMLDANGGIVARAVIEYPAGDLRGFQGFVELARDGASPKAAYEGCLWRVTATDRS